MALNPIVKNAGLAAVGAFVVTFSTAISAFDQPPKLAVIVALVGASLWAGFRAAVGYLKAATASGPFKVDTEA